MNNDLNTIILCAGEGTRLMPLTLRTPKALVPLGGMPLITHLLNLLKEHQITDLVISTYFMAEELERGILELAGEEFRISFLRQILGLQTANPARKAFGSTRKTTLILPCDMVTDIDLGGLLAFHRDKRSALTMAVSQKRPRDFYEDFYGRVVIRRGGRVSEICPQHLENHRGPRWIDTGIYLLEPKVLELIPADLPCGLKEDLLPLVIVRGLPVFAMKTDQYWEDVGSRQRFLKVGRERFSAQPRSFADGLVSISGEIIDQERGYADFDLTAGEAITPQQVADFLDQSGFPAPANIVEHDSGFDNGLFRADTDDGPLAIKCALAGSWYPLWIESQVQKHLEPLNIAPVPLLLDLSGRYFPLPILVSRFLPGRPASEADINPRLTGDIFALLARVHSYSQDDIRRRIPLFPQLPYLSPAEYFFDIVDAFEVYLDWRREQGLKPDRLLKAIVSYLGEAGHWLMQKPDIARETAPPVLCHGDPRLHNFLLDGPKPRLVDWERACLGDPAHEIAWFLVFSKSQLEHSTCPQPWRGMLERIRLYQFLHVIGWPLYLLRHISYYSTERPAVSSSFEELMETYTNDTYRLLASAFNQIELTAGKRHTGYDEAQIAKMGKITP